MGYNSGGTQSSMCTRLRCYNPSGYDERGELLHYHPLKCRRIAGEKYVSQMTTNSFDYIVKICTDVCQIVKIICLYLLYIFRIFIFFVRLSWIKPSLQIVYLKVHCHSNYIVFCCIVNGLYPWVVSPQNWWRHFVFLQGNILWYV